MHTAAGLRQIAQRSLGNIGGKDGRDPALLPVHNQAVTLRQRAHNALANEPRRSGN